MGIPGGRLHGVPDQRAQIDQLGTNLLTVVNGQDTSENEARLPASAAPMIRLVQYAQRVAPTAQMSVRSSTSFQRPRACSGAMNAGVPSSEPT